MEVWIYSIWSIIIVSLISLIWVLTLTIKDEVLNNILIYMISLSAWALFWDAFIHLLPELIEENWFRIEISIGIIWWIILSFILEKIIHWRHCHHVTTKDHPHPLAIMNLFWDALHNFIDWLVIWASFLINIKVWIATTIAVILHEIPQEIWDFWVLIHAWFSKKKALYMNFITSLTSILWLIIALLLSNYVDNINNILIPITIWAFIYIAWSDLIPEMHRNTRTSYAFLQILTFIVWVCLMYTLLLLE